MAEPFLSEIRIMSFDFAPKGWAMCNGQLLPINQNQALFSLLGTAYGGDGRVNFALPDLRGRVPGHWQGGSFTTLGQRGGEQAHTLTGGEMPTHTHLVFGRTDEGNTGTPGSGVAMATAFAIQADQSKLPVSMYSTNAPQDRQLSPNAVANVGGSQAHLNMQPFLVLTFCIALQGIFPSPN
ncbi:MAG TPA: tail fiber protein [Beijerinckiaceae bacterium]|jgi:microcystin-dependent protein